MLFVLAGLVSAEGEIVGQLEVTVCCEETNSGLFCQNVPAEDCSSDGFALPTSCESTTACNPGYCYDSTEGTCLDNVPQMVCTEEGGEWSEEKPNSCNLGCCILGDQASFVTSVRCSRLSSFYGLETNYNSNIQNEPLCILSARSEEKGACVFEKDFQITCEITTRSECTSESLFAESSNTGESVGLDDSLVPADDSDDVGTDEEEEETSSDATAQQFNIDIENIAYSQKTINIKVGDTVIWTNLDSEQHTVTSIGGNELNSVTLNVGDTFSHTFNSEGTFNYDCTFHPGISAMEGTVNVGAVQTSPGDMEFHPGMLCSAEELGTICGPTQDTTCLDGFEEVYFVDSCGNPANIYNANMINDDNYWSFMKDKGESCEQGNGNELSQTCGNCNYLLGTYCGERSSATGSVSYGSNICVSLNCEASEATGGGKRLHGESWCGYDEENFDFVFEDTGNDEFDNLMSNALGDISGDSSVGADYLGIGKGDVGSRFYRYLCSHGEVLVEPCADFRQEECIENNVAGFSEAACRVNRWQDCTTQFNRADCQNSDRRDCKWLEGIEAVLIAGIDTSEGDSSAFSASLGQARAVAAAVDAGERDLGGCVPEIPPGLKFWGTGEEEETSNDELVQLCGQASAFCPVIFEKGLTGGDWECVENCECLPISEGGTGELEAKRGALCMSMGDCGPKINYVGQKGYGTGFEIDVKEIDE